MSRFQAVKNILDQAMGGPSAPVNAPHGAFWRWLSRDEFVQFMFLSLPLVTPGDGNGSNLVKALRGEAPFGHDLGVPGASFERMPPQRPPVPEADIEFIAKWIDDGAPDD